MWYNIKSKGFAVLRIQITAQAVYIINSEGIVYHQGEALHIIKTKFCISSKRSFVYHQAAANTRLRVMIYACGLDKIIGRSYSHFRFSLIKRSQSDDFISIIKDRSRMYKPNVRNAKILFNVAILNLGKDS